MTNTVNTMNTNTRPARRYYTAAEAEKLCKAIRAAEASAKEAAAAAVKCITDMSAKPIYWNNAEARAKSEAARAAKCAEAAAAIAKEAAVNETSRRFTPRRAEKYAKEAEAEAAAARAAAKEAAKEAAEAMRKPTASELKEAAEARINTALEGGNKTPAEVWEAIAAEGYTLIKRAYFIKGIGEEGGKAYYNDVTALCGKVTAALLVYHTSPTSENENTAFTMLKEFIKRVGVKYAFTADTVKVLAARAYTFRRTYGEGYTAAAIGAAGLMKEVLAHVTAAETIAAAAAAKEAAEAKKEARRAARKAAKEAKNSK